MIPPVKSKVWNAAVRDELELLFTTLELVDANRFERYVTASLNGRNYYTDLGETLNGIPWWFIACVHGMEADFSFEAHLHNGDSLKRRTVNAPKGRPLSGNAPFKWLDSAVDALTMPGKELDKVSDWSVPHALWLLESFNGLGYRLYKGIHSPYLWAGTNHYKQGKYVEDGKYSETAVSKQAGCAGLIKLLMEIQQ